MFADEHTIFMAIAWPHLATARSERTLPALTFHGIGSHLKAVEAQLQIALDPETTRLMMGL